MKIKIKDLGYTQSEQYPYTHRVEISYLQDYERVLDWINENNIGACVIGHSQAIYLNPKDTEWLLLKWS